MRRTRRNLAAGFKAKVATAAIKGDKTLVELAEHFDVHFGNNRGPRFPRTSTPDTE